MPAELNSGPADQVPIGHTFGNGPFGVDLRRRVDIWNSACLRLDDHALRIFDTTETTLLNHAYDFRNHALQKLQWRSMDQLERPTCTGGADRASWSIDTGCSNIGDSIISKTFRDVSLCALQIESDEEAGLPDPWNAICIVGFRVYSKDEDLDLRVVIEGGELAEGGMGEKGAQDLDNAQMNAAGAREKTNDCDKTTDELEIIGGEPVLKQKVQPSEERTFGG